MGFDRNLVHVILTLISDLKAELKMYTPTMSILTDDADRLQNTDYLYNCNSGTKALVWSDATIDVGQDPLLLLHDN